MEGECSFDISTMPFLSQMLKIEKSKAQPKAVPSVKAAGLQMIVTPE